MRKLLVLFWAVCMCLFLISCGKDEPTTSSTTLSGVSDGTFTFETGNIQFTVPSGQQYIIANAISSDLTVTICDFDYGDAVLTVSCHNCKQLSESEIIDKLSFWNDNIIREYSGFTQFDNFNFTVIGQKAVFHVYADESRDSSTFYYVSNFTDSHYIYCVEMKFKSSSSNASLSMAEMVPCSQYIGPEKRFGLFQ